MPECGRPPATVAVTDVMGTVFSIAAADPRPSADLVAQVRRWWRWVDAAFSPFLANSQVSMLNRGDLRAADLASEVQEVMALCGQACLATSGFFDAWAGGGFDPCGLVKGWSIEVASAMLTAAGTVNHSINGGGDIRCAGQPEPGRPWRVAVADPVRRGRLAAVAEVGVGAIATSGPAERGDHILDPRTGQQARGLASVTVIGASLTWADAYATAAFAMGSGAATWLRGRPGFEALVIAADGSTTCTPGFPGPGLGTATRRG